VNGKAAYKVQRASHTYTHNYQQGWMEKHGIFIHVNEVIEIGPECLE